MADFARNPSLLRGAFDEIIRWESPLQTFFRATSKEVKIACLRIGPNQKVLPRRRQPGSGVGKKPMSLTFAATPPATLAFGSGIHVCVGQMLARLEAELLFAAFARRVASSELAREPVRRPNNTLRGFAICRSRFSVCPNDFL